MPEMVVPPGDDAIGCSEWCVPLHKVEKAIAGQQFARFFVVDDFMWMGRVVRRGRPDLSLYKHRLTRRYLNLDASGHAYRYHPPKHLMSRSTGSYRPYSNLVAAIDHLELHLLPWMFGSAFVDQNLGLAWEERWRHPDVVAWYERRSGSPDVRSAW